MEAKDWLPIILSVVGSGGLAMYAMNGIGKWYAKRQDDRAADKLADLKKIDELQKQIFAMQQETIQNEIKRTAEAANSTKIQLDMMTLLKAMATSKGTTP